MAVFLISDDMKGVRVQSYSASASSRSKATTLTIKLEVKDQYELGYLMQSLSQLHHPAPKPTKPKRLALPAPDDIKNDG